MTKSRLTPLQVLIKYNSIQKWNEQLMNDDVYVNKRNQLFETFKLFIENGTNTNHQDETGYTLLHYAAQRNNFEIALKLVNIPGIIISVS